MRDAALVCCGPSGARSTSRRSLGYCPEAYLESCPSELFCADAGPGARHTIATKSTRMIRDALFTVSLQLHADLSAPYQGPQPQYLDVANLRASQVIAVAR